MTARGRVALFVLALTHGCGGGHGGTTGSGGASGGTQGGATGGATQAPGSGGRSATGGSSGTGGSNTGGGSGGTASPEGSGGGSGGVTGGSGGVTGGSGGVTNGSGGMQASGGAGGREPGSGGATSSGGVAGGSGGATGGSKGSGGAAGGAGALSTSDPNVVAIVVDPGPSGSYVNGSFAKITLCEPGSQNCQTIDHMLIDTGSTGIRVLESAVKLNLPPATGSSGKNLAECLPFLDGSSWGPVRIADAKIGGETAGQMRLQLIGEATYPIASDCSGAPITDLETLGSNGILGVGLTVEDCGAACASTGFSNPGLYYECSSGKAGACVMAAVPIANQIANPIASFSGDNNGSFLQFPAVPDAGAATSDGFLVFGIGTRANNALGAAKVIPVDGNGFCTTLYPSGGGTRYASFLDSGSNGLYFLSSGSTNIATCTGGTWTGFYCPSATTTLRASLVAKDGSEVPVTASIGNASRLSLSDAALGELAGPLSSFGDNATGVGFDWGLPFYYGRTVFTALESHDTPAGPGPYFAF